MSKPRAFLYPHLMVQASDATPNVSLLRYRLKVQLCGLPPLAPTRVVKCDRTRRGQMPKNSPSGKRTRKSAGRMPCQAELVAWEREDKIREHLKRMCGKLKLKNCWIKWVRGWKDMARTERNKLRTLWRRKQTILTGFKNRYAEIRLYCTHLVQ